MAVDGDQSDGGFVERACQSHHEPGESLRQVQRMAEQYFDVLGTKPAWAQGVYEASLDAVARVSLPMTFQDFQASKRVCDDLDSRFPDDVLPGTKGWLYCGERHWIEDTSTWPEDVPGRDQGKWYTRIGNMEYQSDKLEDCERPLYDFARSER